MDKIPVILTKDMVSKKERGHENKRILALITIGLTPDNENFALFTKAMKTEAGTHERLSALQDFFNNAKIPGGWESTDTAWKQEEFFLLHSAGDRVDPLGPFWWGHNVPLGPFWWG
ncbi:MAG: hypothetical protein ACW98F_19795 [Candidatus Hodarchaeales archaeon]